VTIAWVTGGGTGIGYAVARRLYQGGACVIITGRRPDVLEQAVKTISSLPSSGHILGIPGDASNPSHVGDVAAQAVHRWGPIDFLVNNAGVNFNHEFSETPVEEYRATWEVNCFAAVRTVSAVLPDMLKAGSGTIVNISSIYGKWASSDSASYSVGKYALAGYTDVLQQALLGRGIQVLGVYPGFIKTAMTLPFVEEGSFQARRGKTPDEMAEAIFRALRRGKSQLYFPWYVPWVLRVHRWFPRISDRLARRFRHR
jgi:short-subunit dehydrogenase